MDFPNLESMIQPREIAIIGASDREGSHARTTYENITEVSSFDEDKVHLVNPKYNTLFGKKCYKSVKDINSNHVDVVIIVIKADLAVKAVKESDECHIPFAIIMSSGFAEIGEEGEVFQEQLQDVIKQGNIRVYGPNCPGLININRRLGMTFSPAFKHDTLGGGIGLITQGGGVGRSLLQGMKRGIGFGYFVSLGNEIDLELSDFIYHMVNDPEIKVITIVAEGFKDGEKFKKAAEYAIKKEKPIVILKVGRTELGQKAVMSHTGKLAGSDRVFDALCDQFGIIRVNDVDELLETSSLFSRHGVMKEGNIAIITGSGGSGALLADQIGSKGLHLAKFNSNTINELKKVTPPFAALNNPVDLTATALEDEQMHSKSIEIIAKDENVNIIIEPIASSYGNKTVQRSNDLVQTQKNNAKTLIIGTWMSSMTEGGYQTLVEGGLVPFKSIRNTVNALERYISYGEYIKNKVPISIPSKKGNKKYNVQIPSETRVLNEMKSKEILRSVGVDFPHEVLVQSYLEAVDLVHPIKYPVVLKCVSDELPHKTEAGAVKVNINSDKELKKAFDEIYQSVNNYNPEVNIEGYLISEMIENGLEMIVGIKYDRQFGPTVLVGMGGIYTEVLEDISIGICPVSREYALAMISNLKTASLLEEFRGNRKRDIDKLATMIEKVSYFAIEMKEKIEEIDLNPVLILNEGEGVRAVDALIVTKSN